MSKKDDGGLNQQQIDFIVKKVKELGSYNAACEFYKARDMVSDFACDVAHKIYVTKNFDENEVKAKPEKKAKKKAKTVKRKRKIDVDKVLDDEEE